MADPNGVRMVDVLFSFDRSGSMGGSIEDAKNSAISVLPILGSNSTFIEIEAFSNGVNVLLSYANNITEAESAISTLYSSGGTALYDAIVSAGNNAVQHKNDFNASRLSLSYIRMVWKTLHPLP